MLSSKIRELRKRNNMSQQELGKKLNVGKTTISNYETGYSEPDSNTLTKIANIFDVSVDYLLGIDSNPNKTNDKFLVPVVGSVSCGEPFIAVEDILDYEELDPKLKNQGEFFGLRLKGQSMTPKFDEGDVVIVRKQSDVDNGDIAIVRVNGDEATMKIVQKSPDGITLVATNTSVYKPHFYSNKDIETLPVSIIGKVIELRAKIG
ncbi:MAG: XRE family transcriptional regulator [Finegoldia sp.]|nr:XRE family transcriptional regulator [Finegoldia sp.]